MFSLAPLSQKHTKVKTVERESQRTSRQTARVRRTAEPSGGLSCVCISTYIYQNSVAEDYASTLGRQPQTPNPKPYSKPKLNPKEPEAQSPKTPTLQVFRGPHRFESRSAAFGGGHGCQEPPNKAGDGVYLVDLVLRVSALGCGIWGLGFGGFGIRVVRFARALCRTLEGSLWLRHWKGSYPGSIKV